MASLLAVLLILHALWLWQPARQVRLHQRHFLDAAENRRWSRFASFLDPAYTDRWGHDRAVVVRETSEVLRQFFALTIESEEWQCEIAGGRGTVTQRLRLEGNGTAIAQFAQQEVNALREPFVFTWKHASWKPWDWQLARVDHPQLRLGD